jgi:hypothetical protein
LIAGIASAACAGKRAGDAGPRDPNTITLEEIAQADEEGIRDLYELIDRQRPRWLQGRTPRSLNLPTVIAVYHHETLLGGIDVLRGYPLASVTSLHYLDAAQAMLLPGAGSSHIEGAIVISTRIAPDSGLGPPPSRLSRGGA